MERMQKENYHKTDHKTNSEVHKIHKIQHKFYCTILRMHSTCTVKFLEYCTLASCYIKPIVNLAQ